MEQIVQICSLIIPVDLWTSPNLQTLIFVYIAANWGIILAKFTWRIWISFKNIKYQQLFPQQTAPTEVKKFEIIGRS